MCFGANFPHITGKNLARFSDILINIIQYSHDPNKQRYVTVANHRGSLLIDHNDRIRQRILIDQDDCIDSIDELMIDHYIPNN
jgi:hypothetical protein